MNWELLVWIGVGFSAVPCLLFISNLFAYRAPARKLDEVMTVENHDLRGTALVRPSVSVLIPARNEESNLPATLESVLSNTRVDLEVVVLDDHSTDRTASIVREFQQRDARVRLELAPPLPPGWCGKQHACWVLSRLATRPWIVFLDADVRLEPSALIEMVGFMESSGADLASGVPRQETKTFGERLLIPLIHFVLLGFLPMHVMRRSKSSAFAAGCGQLFIARHQAYLQSGGHSQIPATLHDGLQLPKLFRRSGLRTDLFDATPLAACRMYRSSREVLSGLAKNATEGLAHPKRIVPMSMLLLAGQVLPWVAAAGGWNNGLDASGRALATLSVVLSILPRIIAIGLFRQSSLGAALHPIGVLALLGIQWFALLRSVLGRPAVWKGRQYGSAAPMQPRASAAAAPATGTALLAGIGIGALLMIALPSRLHAGGPQGPSEVFRLETFSLEDQFGVRHQVAFPTRTITVMTFADREGANQLEPWIRGFKEHKFDTNRVALCGVADVRRVPSFLRGLVRRRFAEHYSHPILMDWKGQIAARPLLKSGVANVLVLTPEGVLSRQFSGAATPELIRELSSSIQQLLQASSARP